MPNTACCLAAALACGSGAVLSHESAGWRTLLDLAASCPPAQLQSAVDRAKRLRRLDLPAIDAFLDRLPGAPGSVALRNSLALYRTPAFDRARSELLFLDLVKRARLPTPVLNIWVEKFEIDAYWEAERFAVEVDGWETHGTRKAFEDDRLRIEEMALAGIFPVCGRKRVRT